MVNSIATRLGALIRLNRIKLGMTQFQLAEDICSQAMISSIERGIDVPNVILFKKICNRLQIKETNQFLDHAMHMTSFDSFSRKIFDMCKKHNYKGMIELMDNSNILDELIYDQDIQTYYYYYSCALYQLEINTKEAVRYLNLAIHMTMKQPYHPKSALEMLLINGLAVLYLKIGYADKAVHLFEAVYRQFIKTKVSSENLNAISYNYGNYLYQEEKYQEALAILLNGFDDVVRKQSYFMLAEYALSVAHCYEKLGNSKKATDYQNKHSVLIDIVNLKVE